jgi:hypothetical protein
VQRHHPFRVVLDIDQHQLGIPRRDLFLAAGNPSPKAGDISLKKRRSQRMAVDIPLGLAALQDDLPSPFLAQRSPISSLSQSGD